MNSTIPIRESDQRATPRVSCALQAELDTGEICEVLDLSTGGAFIAVPELEYSRQEVTIRFSLIDGEESRPEALKTPLKLAAVVKRRRHLKEGHIGLGVEFTDIDQRTSKQLHQYVIRHVIDDIVDVVERQMMDIDPFQLQLTTQENDAVLKLLRQIEESSTELSLMIRGVGEIMTGQMVSIQPRSLLIELDQLPEHRPLAARVHVTCTLQHHNHYFFGDALGWEDGALRIQMPTNVFSHDIRTSPRKSAEGTRLRVEIPLPYPPQAILSRPVIDISKEGLAFKAPANESYFLVGTPLNEIRVVGDGDVQPLRSGQVRHVTPIAENGEITHLKIGVKFQIMLGTSRLMTDKKISSSKEMSFFNRMATFIKHLTVGKLSSARSQQGPAGPPVDVVRYANSKREEIAAILNMTSHSEERLHAPLVVISPALGKRKESTYAFAMTLVENFKRHKRELVVLRYDGVRTLGESYKPPEDRKPGRECMSWRLSQCIDDLSATLDFAYNNPRFYPTEVIIIAPSIQAVPTRKYLVRNHNQQVHYWISFMGVTAMQEVLINTSGGIDYIALHIQRVELGLRQILSITSNMNPFCADVINNGMAFIEDARHDMAKIDIPVTWIYGEFDAWIDASNVREIMESPAKAPRELVGLPVGHVPLNGAEALMCFKETVRRIWQFLFKEEIDPVTPPPLEILRRRQLEWSRTIRYDLGDRKDYWQKFLMGNEGESDGYSIHEFFKEYRDFIKKEVELLDLKPGMHLADMGTGLGNLPTLYLERYGGRKAWQIGKITMVDFVQEGLDSAKERLEKLAAHLNKPLPPTDFVLQNLQMSPTRALRRFLQGEFYGYDALKGTIPGLSDYSVEAWKRLADWRLHGLLRGRPVTDDDQDFIHRNLTPSEQVVLLDFNRLTRFVQGDALPEDFKPEKTRGGRHPAPQALSDLRLDTLRPNLGSLPERLPFEDNTFDRVVCSLVLSYLDNPAETLTEFVRCLKPGGKIVFSSMKPDVDTGRTYMNALRRLESKEEVHLPDGFTRESLINGIRKRINSIAFLLQLAEEVQFRFFFEDEMLQLAERAGLSRVELCQSYGDPSQAYIAVGYKL